MAVRRLSASAAEGSRWLMSPDDRHWDFPVLQAGCPERQLWAHAVMVGRPFETADQPFEIVITDFEPSLTEAAGLSWPRPHAGIPARTSKKP